MPVTPEHRTQAILLLVLASVLGLVGIGVVVMLFRAWRRFNERNRLARGEGRSPELGPDPWLAAGQRIETETEDDDGGDDEPDA